jgi:hypothetical protein
MVLKLAEVIFVGETYVFALQGEAEVQAGEPIGEFSATAN